MKETSRLLSRLVALASDKDSPGGARSMEASPFPHKQVSCSLTGNAGATSGKKDKGQGTGRDKRESSCHHLPDRRAISDFTDVLRGATISIEIR
jgi:hypothetical protein